MLNLSKVRDYFDPAKVEGRIQIVGCGSVGSELAETLARCGLEEFTLWDFDYVEAHNIANQNYSDKQIGLPKVEALKDILIEINPDISEKLVTKPDGWDGERLTGYIFLCVDSIELRRKILDSIKTNPRVKAVFDFRTMLTGAQHYAADWRDTKDRQNLLKSMNFSHEEAAAETPVSACGITLGVVTTVRLIVSLGANNFINFIKGNGLKKYVMIDGFELEAF